MEGRQHWQPECEKQFVLRSDYHAVENVASSSNPLAPAGKNYMRLVVMAFAIIFVSNNLFASERLTHLPTRLKIITRGGEYFDNDNC